MRLAVCDDHRLFADALSAALVRRGHEILATTAEPEVLLDELSRHQADLCLLDVDFRHGSGVEVADRLRLVAPTTAVLLLTGTCNDQVWDAYERRAIDGIVNKVSAFVVLEEAIRRVAGGERVVEGWSAPRSRTPPGRGAADAVTARENEVLQLVVQGLSTETMADRLGVSTHTIRTHVQNVLRKLGVHGRGKVARAGVEAGLVDPATLAMSTTRSEPSR
jgi:DNA-binding NarL/FixJ family response regulator